MEPYQERVVSERDELEIKILKLAEFIRQGDDYTFSRLPLDEQLRLRAQLSAMRVYSHILATRIEQW